MGAICSENNSFSETIMKVYHDGYKENHGLSHELYAILILKELIKESVTKVECKPFESGYECKDDILAKFMSFVDQYYPEFNFKTMLLNDSLLAHIDPFVMRDITRDYKLLMNDFVLEKLEVEFNIIENTIVIDQSIRKKIMANKRRIQRGLKVEDELKDLDENSLPSQYIMSYCMSFGEICTEFLIRVLGIDFVLKSHNGYHTILTGKTKFVIEQKDGCDDKSTIYKYKRLYYINPSDPLEYYGSYVECPSLPYDDGEYTEYIEDDNGFFQKLDGNNDKRMILELPLMKLQ